MLASLYLAISQSDLFKIANPVIEMCQEIVPVLLSVVGALGAIWCIFVGVKFATSDDPQEHEKAKRSLKNSIIGYILIFALLIMLNVGANVLSAWYTSSVS